MTALVAWLLTYLAHSTLLLGASWAAVRLLRERRLALQEGLLRFALVGAILTSALQVGLSLEPAAGSLSLAAAPPVASAPPAARPLPAPTPAPAPREIPWAALLLGAWALVAGGSLLRLGMASLRLRHVLGSGRALVEGALPRTARRAAAALGLARPVELRASARIAVPFAAGIRRPRVCLPERVLTDLGPREQEGLCAHELAHLRRRDPEWVLAHRIVAGTLFFQPLNHWATRQLGELSECLSDELAARATGRAPALARSLVEVADWTAGGAALPAATAVRAPRGLGRRIDRLEKLMRDHPRPTRHTDPGRRWLPLAALALFAGTALLPGVSDRSASAAPLPQEPPAAAPSAAEERELARIEERLQEAAEERAHREEQRQAERAEVQAEREREAERDRVSADEDASVEEIEVAIGRIQVEMERAAREIEEAVQLESEEIERALEEVGPSEEELRRVEAELGALGEELGRTIQEHLETTRELHRERGQELRQEQRDELRLRQREHREQMRELREQMREQAERLRLSTEDRARIRLRMREVRPQQDRLRELSRQLGRLTRQLVRSVWRDGWNEEPPEPPETPEVPEAPEPPEVPEAAAVPAPPAAPLAPRPPAPAAAPVAPQPPEPPAADRKRERHTRSSESAASGLLPRLPVAL